MAGPRLLDRVRAAIRTRQYSYRTEQAYVHWIRRFILFHGRRHPRDMGKREVEAFLTHLAVERHVSPSTQNQALSAVLFPTRRCSSASSSGSRTSCARSGAPGSPSCSPPRRPAS